MSDQKQHWDKIYATRQSREMSWTQDYPTTSLDFIHQANLNKEARIIDIGGGNSRLVDVLLEEGFENITVLDISEEAIKKVQERLGDKASQVKWIVSDVTEFTPDIQYDFWHDRATFHFLITTSQINQYLHVASQSVKENHFMMIGTFSEDGPSRCSGLEVRQYSEEKLSHTLEEGFEKIKCIHEEHRTPFNSSQQFLFCSFRRR